MDVPSKFGEAPPRRGWLWWLPLIAGAVVLPLCWTVLIVTAQANGGSCYGGMTLQGIGDGLARDFNLPVLPAIAEIALLLYAGACLVPYLLLWGCTALVARAHARRLQAILSIGGAVLISLFYAVAYIGAGPDLSHGGMLCSLLFDLVPIAGTIAGAGATVMAGLAGFVVERVARRAH